MYRTVEKATGGYKWFVERLDQLTSVNPTRRQLPLSLARAKGGGMEGLSGGVQLSIEQVSLLFGGIGFL